MTNILNQEFGASADAIEFHYGTGNEYFSTWLGETMSYSCALWDDNNPNQSLDDAQLAKIRHHIEQSRSCLLYTSPSPRDQRGSRMPSSA